MMELAEMQNFRERCLLVTEAMILEFEKCHTTSWGRNNISLEKMEFIGSASKHGFSAIGLDKQPKVLTVNYG